MALSGAEPAAAVGEPRNVSPPEITGTARAGRTLSSTNGDWSSLLSISYARQWYRCTSACQPIAGATQPTYTLTAADIDRRMLVRVTATNALGSTSADSRRVGPVEPDPPQSLSRPTFSGTPREGETLTVTSEGTWTNDPFFFDYRWRRCDSAGGGCQDIGAAVGSRYELSVADVGHTIRLRVLATGPFGTGSADSDPSPVIRGRESAAAPEPGRPAGPNQPTRSRPRRPLLLRPFPSILLVGRVVGPGTLLTAVTVRSPRRTVVRVTCRGPGCPFRRRSLRMRGRNVRIRSLQGAFGRGAVLVFRVTGPGRIGKYTRVRFRLRRVPARVDRCLYPGSSRPRRCPRR